MNAYLIRSPTSEEWAAIAGLLAESIPNNLVSHFGPRFGALYYRHLAAPPAACSFAAFNATETLAGVIIGTFDRRRSRRLPPGLTLRLAATAHLRLLSPRFLLWLARTPQSSSTPANAPAPRAELLELAVDPSCRGQSLAPRLLARLEEEFRAHGQSHVYAIRTEQSNLTANRFYAQIGATLAGTFLHHGRRINEWHKELA